MNEKFTFKFLCYNVNTRLMLRDVEIEDLLCTCAMLCNYYGYSLSFHLFLPYFLHLSI